MKKLRFALFITLTALAVSITLPQFAVAQDQKEQKDPDIVLGVDGMSCPFCAFGIEKKLNKLDTIKSLDVKLEEGFVDIYLKPEQQLSEAELQKAVKKAGFSVRSIEYVNKNAQPTKAG